MVKKKKKSTCLCRRPRRLGFSPWVGKIPWRREWQPTAVFLPGKKIPWTEETGKLQSMELQREKWLSMHTRTLIQASLGNLRDSSRDLPWMPKSNSSLLQLPLGIHGFCILGGRELAVFHHNSYLIKSGLQVALEDGRWSEFS